MSTALIAPIYNELKKLTAQSLIADAKELAYAFLLGLSENDGALLDSWLQDDTNALSFNRIINNSGDLLNIAQLHGPMTAVANSAEAVTAIVTLTTALDTLWSDTAARSSLLSSTVANDVLAAQLSAGQAVWVTPGTYNWTVPDGVYVISAVAVGGGGGGHSGSIHNSGGGGGGLGYRNKIAVTPGEVLTIAVADGGTRGTNSVNGSAQPGGDSYVIAPSIVAGLGGKPGTGDIYSPTSQYLSGGEFIGDGGGRGGNGGYSQYAGGGGGAGGYSGPGGSGSLVDDYGAGGNGSGGGGGAGGNGGSIDAAGNGGGVGIYGEGLSGTGGAGDSSDAFNGQGGSNGEDGGEGFGVQQGSNTFINRGGRFGGGGGACDNPSDEHGAGGSGAVRIIWNGIARQFPATLTEDV